MHRVNPNRVGLTRATTRRTATRRLSARGAETGEFEFELTLTRVHSACSGEHEPPVH